MENTFRKTFIQRMVNTLLKYHRVFSAVLVLLFVFSFFSAGWTSVEEDSASFLPVDSQSRESLRLVEKEFSSYGTAEVYGEHLSDSDSDSLIRSVTSLENIAYFTQEVEPSSDGYGNSVYLSLAFDSLMSSSDSLSTARQLATVASGYGNVYVYSPLLETSADASHGQLRAVLTLTAIGVFILLLLTTQSFAEVIVLLVCFLVSAVIQKGTNFVFGTVSMLSDTLSLSLQLMMTSVFFFLFLGRYWDARKTREVPEAVRVGLYLASPEILTAAFITAADLVAMLFLRVAVGRELGLVLLKSVIISLINVLLLMPTLVLLCGKLMDKTHHRRLLPIGIPLGKFAWVTRFILPPVFVFLLIVSVSMASDIRITYDSANVSNHNQSSNEIAYGKLLEAGKTNRIELLFPTGDYENERALAESLLACDGVENVTALAGLRVLDSFNLTVEVGYSDIMSLTGMDEIASKAVLAMYAARNSEYETVLKDVSSYRAPFLDVLLCLHDNLDSPTLNLTSQQIDAFEELYLYFNRICKELQGNTYSRMYISLNLPMEGQTTVDALHEILRRSTAIYGSDTYICGSSVMSMECQQVYGRDMTVAMAFGIFLILVILLVAYRSLSLPLLLVVLIQGAIWINMARIAYAGTTTFFMVPVVVSCVLMGPNLAYAMTVTTRYLEARRVMEDRRQAMTAALRGALPISLPAGAIFALSGYLLSKGMGLGIAAGVGLPLAVGTILSLAVLVLVLPQSILLFEGLLMRTSLTRMLAVDPAKAARIRRGVVGWIMTGAGLLSALTALVLWVASGNLRDEKINGYKNDIVTIDSLVPLVQEYETLTAELEDSSLDFAEHLLTDQIGSAWVGEGESTLSQGKGALEQQKKEYEKNSEQYEQSLQQYEAGKAQYEEALENYNASVAQYNAGVAEYEQAKEDLASIEPVYNRVIGPYNDYMKIQAEYDEAVSNGNVQKAAFLYMTVQTQKALYESAITASGYSISMLVAEYEASEHELAQAEENLALTRQSLDETKAQLEQGKAALEAGKEALAATGIDLEEDYDKLKQDMEAYEAEVEELDETKDRLDDNSETLARDIEKLTRATNLGDQLTSSIESMYSFEAVRNKISKNADSAEILSLLLNYCRDQIVAAESKWNGLMASMGALFLSGLLTFMVGGTGLIKRRTRTLNNVSSVAAILAVLSLVLWIVFGTEWYSLVIPVCAILFLIAVASIALYKSGKYE